ncbi:MAG TPA: alkaline phosphatase family protein [Bryobacteraceae bacterium]|nr:alkaline phosphatase family protein [Bryobacteraceae bacterium]
MSSSEFPTRARQHFAVGTAILALLANLGTPAPAGAQDHPATATPIQHVIVIIGENRSFDHVYATYKPASGQTVSNLLSKGIIDAKGQPGSNRALAAQFNALDTTTYGISPTPKKEYPNIPPPGTQGAPTVASDSSPAPFQTLAVAELAEPDLFGKYNNYLITGATGLPNDVVDTRVKGAYDLGSGPFQITPSIVYDSYTGSPVHRFYQMWQQTDCATSHTTSANPSGCLDDLFSWVEVTIGAGNNGAPQTQPFTEISTGEGSDALGFYNVQNGDAPYMKYLADNYTLSDNMHQSVMGGTGANHIMFGYADALWYSDGNGHIATPPAEQIENPNPQTGANNWYDQDGYSGGSYSNCSDLSQPGVPAVVNYLESLKTPISPRCTSNAYYLLNNYNPGYIGNGGLATPYSAFTLPPTAQPHIGDVLSGAGISYTYFGEGWNLYVADPAGTNPYDAYCNICNPFQYASDIMTNSAQVEAHIQDTTALYEDIDTGNLPAVSIVKPSGFVDGHPASSKLDLFEGFVNRIVNQVQASPLWSSTAIFITFDEGGGYYDSGYIQPVDFFGDGTRIPLLIVSPYSTGGIVNHSYADHVSIVKFIERNWSLPTIGPKTRDNFRNPVVGSNPYVPTNSPALDDLFDAFNFGDPGTK